jgi:hypothetical protein
MWVIAVFHQVSLFSLKTSDATSTGGRTLLVPTPCSIKMALLDVALRTYGMDAGSESFPLIRDLTLAMSPPQQIVVNNCFVRIYKPRRPKSSQGGMKRGQDDEQSETGEEREGDDAGQGPYIRSVAFREYAQYSGPLGLAVQVETEPTAEHLSSLLLQLNYLGKRGSFFQIDGPPLIRDHLPIEQGYLLLGEEGATTKVVSPGYTLQVLDDWGPKMTFDKANIYSDAPIGVGKDRIPRQVLLPYRVIRSSQGFTLYQRTDLP